MPTAITDWGSAMMTSLAAALAMFLSAIPKIIGFALIVVVGWLLSGLVEKGIASILRAVRFNDLANRSGLADFINKMGTGTDSAGMIGIVAKWFIRLIALVVAFDALGLPAVSEVLRDLLLWLPNVVVALVVLVIGGLAAKALSNLVRGAMAEAGLTNSNLLAKLSGALVWAFAIVVAVNQIGIATTLVNTLFMAFVGAIALGLGLAFGLGGRETAGRLVNQWYEKAREKGPQLAHAVEAGGDIAQREAARIGDQYGSSSGRYAGHYGDEGRSMGGQHAAASTMHGSAGDRAMGGSSMGGNYGAPGTTAGMGSTPSDYNRGEFRGSSGGGMQGGNQGGYTGGGAQVGGQYGGRPMGNDSLATNSPMGGGSMHPGASRADYGQQGGAGSRANDPFDYPTPSAPRRDE